MAIINPIPPAFPVPVLPQSFDTSLSYYELLARLTEALNGVIETVNNITNSITLIQSQIADIDSQIGEIPAEVAEITENLAEEKAARIAADESILGRIGGLAIRLETEYVTFDDLDTDYLVDGITFEYITQEDYDELSVYVAKRVYIVDNDGKITMIFHATTNDEGEIITGHVTAYSGGARQVGQRAGRSIIGFAETPQE